MHQTVGKLAALAAVVGIGVAVVLHAQRNMQTNDPKPESAAADTDPEADDPDMSADADLPGDQDEPELAFEDSDLFPDVDKTVRNPRRDKRIVKAGGAKKTKPANPDDDDISRNRERPGVAGDPFDEDDDALGGRKPSRQTAAASRSKINILDMDDESPSATEIPPASKRSPNSGSRGAVLSLEDPDDNELEPTPRKRVVGTKSKPKPSAGPRLLGGTDDEDAASMPEDSSADKLLGDDDTPATSSPKREPPEDIDDSDPQDDISKPVDEPAGPPRELADDKPVPIRPRAQRPSRLEDDEPDNSIDPPTANIERRPAELDPTIEIDDGASPIPPQKKGPLPQVTIEKQAPNSAVLGKPMVYHIFVRNVGKIPAHQVVVEDVIPSDVEVDGSIPQALLKEDRLIWKLGTLAAGQEKKIAVRVIPRSEGTIGGVATVNFSPEPAGTKANSPQLKFDVSAPRQAAVGTPVEFSFVVRNVGTVSANNVTIRDVLPAGLKHPDGDDLEYNLGELPAGKSQDIKLTLTAANAGSTINRVVVTADGDVAEEAEVKLEIVGPMLLVSRNGPKRLFPEKTASFSNTVTNPGTKPMTGITVIEKIPPGMEYVSSGEGGVYDQSKRSVFWSIKQLNPGEARAVTITLRTAARGAQISVIRAFDSFGSSGETTATAKVSGAPALTLEFGDIPALVEPGETVKIAMRILNRGSDTATGVRATIIVPAELKIISADGPTSYREQAGNRGDGTARTTDLHFATIGKIEPKGDAVFELTVKAGATGTVQIEMQAVCEQLTDPIRRQEVMNIVMP
jgi:uncharacterized repeat protein (TIGR01451 family)